MNTLVSTTDFTFFKSELTEQLEWQDSLKAFTLQLIQDSNLYEAKLDKGGLLTIQVPSKRRIRENLFSKDGQTLRREEQELRQIMATHAPDAPFVNLQTF